MLRINIGYIEPVIEIVPIQEENKCTLHSNRDLKLINSKKKKREKKEKNECSQSCYVHVSVDAYE